MPKKGQTMRFTDGELSLIKGLFADNEALLYAIRKSMLGFVLDENESALIKGLSKEAFAVIRKMFLPHIEPEAPLFQMTHMVVGLNVEIKGLLKEDALPLIEAKAVELQYISERLDILEGKSDVSTVSLKELGDIIGGLSVPKSESKVFVNVTAHNYLLSYIDSNCKQLMILSSAKEETVDEKVDKVKKNSAK